MGTIQPITLDTAKWSTSSAPYGVIDDFLAVIDGRKNFTDAVALSRELIQQPDFQAVAVIRNSTTLDRSFERIGHFMLVKEKFGCGAIEGRVFAWPERDKYLYIDEGLTSLFRHKTFAKRNADRNIGPDLHDIMWEARKFYPEYLCWSVRKLKSGIPGLLHYDECYRPGLRNIFNLPKKFMQDANHLNFKPLEGSITLSTSLANGGSIVCKTSEILDYQNIYDKDCPLTGHQAQEGDLLILKDQGWDKNKDHHPAFHCPPKTDNILQNRFVAIASSNAGFLAPQVREHLGRSRLPNNDPIEVFLDNFDHIERDTKPEHIVQALKGISPSILAQAPSNILDRFPTQTQEILKPYIS